MMTFAEHTWWDEWCLTWYAIGWRVGVGKVRLHDALDVTAGLMLRIARLELQQARSGVFGLGIL